MYQQRKRMCNFWQNRLENRDFLAGEGRGKGGKFGQPETRKGISRKKDGRIDGTEKYF